MNSNRAVAICPYATIATYGSMQCRHYILLFMLTDHYSSLSGNPNPVGGLDLTNILFSIQDIDKYRYVIIVICSI